MRVRLYASMHMLGNGWPAVRPMSYRCFVFFLKPPPVVSPLKRGRRVWHMRKHVAQLGARVTRRPQAQRGVFVISFPLFFLNKIQPLVCLILVFSFSWFIKNLYGFMNILFFLTFYFYLFQDFRICKYFS